MATNVLCVCVWVQKVFLFVDFIINRKAKKSVIKLRILGCERCGIFELPAVSFLFLCWRGKKRAHLLALHVYTLPVMMMMVVMIMIYQDILIVVPKMMKIHVCKRAKSSDKKQSTQHTAHIWCFNLKSVNWCWEIEVKLHLPTSSSSDIHCLLGCLLARLVSRNRISTKLFLDGN